MKHTPTVLVTSSRMPFAVDEIRKFGEAGWTVFAADTFATAPGQHSRHVSEALITPSPREQPGAYVERIAALAREHEIDMLVPTFEEAFYLAASRARLGPKLELFAPEFDTLARLHHKLEFLRLAEQLGMDVPRTIAAGSREELAAATREFEHYFARPAYSRGGTELLTNHGELADTLEIEDCSPSADNPWLVQPFVEGEDRCCFGVAWRGQLAAHVTYATPKTLDGVGGIVFESVDEPELVQLSQRLIERTGYHGQISLDFLRTEDGRMIPIECNPRATAGVTLMNTSDFVSAVRGPAPERAPRVTPAGVKRQIGAALLRDMVLNWKEIPEDLRALLRGGEDIYAAADDLLPGLFQVLSYVHVLRHRRDHEHNHQRSALVTAYLHDISWNGEPIP